MHVSVVLWLVTVIQIYSPYNINLQRGSQGPQSGKSAANLFDLFFVMT